MSPVLPAPAEAVVLKSDQPRDNFTIDYPWELNNTDYLRRVLAHVTYTLRPLYEKAVTSKARGGAGLAKWKQAGTCRDVEPADADAQTVLQHILRFKSHYTTVLCMPEAKLEDYAAWLKKERNELAHERLNGVGKQRLLEAFQKAGELATASRQHFSQTNLHNLQKQWIQHINSKEQRKPPEGDKAGPSKPRGEDKAGSSTSSQGRQEGRCHFVKHVEDEATTLEMLEQDKIGNIGEVVAAMRRHIHSPAVTKAACTIIAARCADYETTEDYIYSDGLDDDDIPLTPEIIFGHSPCSNPWAQVAKQGLMKGLQSALRKHGGSSDVATEVLWAVHNACDPIGDNGSKNRNAAGAIGMLADIKAALLKHKGVPGVESVCRSLMARLRIEDKW